MSCNYFDIACEEKSLALRLTVIVKGIVRGINSWPRSPNNVPRHKNRDHVYSDFSFRGVSSTGQRAEFCLLRVDPFGDMLRKRWILS